LKFHKAYNRVREENFLLDGLLGFDMFRKTVGIIGTGKIGTVAGRILAQGFGCHVLTYDVHENPAVQEFGGESVSLQQLLRESDIVSLHVPLTPETHHMINAETLAIMKPGAMLINTSRGALIDTKALLKSVESRHTGAVGLDVYEEEEHIFYKNLSEQIIADETFMLLLTFPNVVVTGHQAYFTREAIVQIAETTIQNITDFLNAVSNKNILSASKVINKA
jgi:D-lactate dehydrogenase